MSISKPNITLPTWAFCLTAAVQEPSSTKKSIGWLVAEKPPAQWFNWILSSLCLWTNYCVASIDALNTSITSSFTPVGTVHEYLGTTLPSPNFLFLQGQLLNITDYPALHSVIGNTYGGDGITTFKLPDGQHRVPVGAGTLSGFTPRVLGSIGGEESHQLVVNEISTHNHTATFTHTHNVTDAGHIHSINDPQHRHSGYWPRTDYQGKHTGNAQDEPGGNKTYYTDYAVTGITIASAQSNITISSNTGNVQINNSGGNQAHNNMQPFFVVNYIIKAK